MNGAWDLGFGTSCERSQWSWPSTMEIFDKFKYARAIPLCHISYIIENRYIICVRFKSAACMNASSCGSRDENYIDDPIE